jgi:hypothetical protein
MRWRNIHKSEVESAIEAPDFEDRISGNRTHAWKRMSEGHLRVTYLESEGELLILSAVKKKKGWG